MYFSPALVSHSESTAIVIHGHRTRSGHFVVVVVVVVAVVMVVIVLDEVVERGLVIACVVDSLLAVGRKHM